VKRSHVVADFVWQTVSTGEIKILTDGEEQRQFIRVDDVCSAFHVAIDTNATGIYDIASFEWCKVIDVAHLVADLTGARVVPGMRGGSTPITPMVGKLPSWRPTVSLEEGLRQMVVGISEKK
jgi:nucleoside-diphosphate-sugar epimerase